VLVVSGAIGLTGVRLAPVQAMRGDAPIAGAGEYLLRLTTAAGATFELPFDAVLVDHAMPPERHFLVRIPSPGPLATLEVLRGGAVIAARSASPAAVDAIRAAAVAPGVDAVEAAGELVVTWDAARYPFAMVVHVGAAGRTVQAVDAQGGRLRIDTADLTGGVFEISLSDGLNTLLRVFGR
jgi:hypothetical protein